MAAIIRAIMLASAGVLAVERLPLNDVASLANVFRGGQPWLLFCAGAMHGSEEKLPAFAGFREVARVLSVRGTVQSAVLDCDARLPSGKSTIARFGLRRTRPLLIFCDKGETPSQLPNSEFVRIEHVAPGGRGKSKGRAKRTRAAVINATALLDVIEKRTQLQLYSVTKQVTFRKRCLSRRACALVMHWGRLEAQQLTALSRVMQRHRNITFVQLDVQQHKIALQKRLPKLDTGGASQGQARPPRLVVLKPVSRLRKVVEQLRIPFERTLPVPLHVGGSKSEDAPVLLSLSAAKLRAGTAANWTRRQADKVFDKRLVSYDQFVGRGRDMLHHANAIFEIGGRRYPWGVASQYLATQALFGQRMSQADLEQELTNELRRQARALIRRDPRRQRFQAKAHIGAFTEHSMRKFLRRVDQHRVKMGQISERKLQVRRRKRKRGRKYGQTGGRKRSSSSAARRRARGSGTGSGSRSAHASHGSSNGGAASRKHRRRRRGAASGERIEIPRKARRRGSSSAPAPPPRWKMEQEKTAERAEKRSASEGALSEEDVDAEQQRVEAARRSELERQAQEHMPQQCGEDGEDCSADAGEEDTEDDAEVIELDDSEDSDEDSDPDAAAAGDAEADADVEAGGDNDDDGETESDSDASEEADGDDFDADADDDQEESESAEREEGEDEDMPERV